MCAIANGTDKRGAMTAFAINEHQYLIATHSTKLWQANKRPAVIYRKALDLERWHERRDDIDQIIRRNAFEILLLEHIHRHGRSGGRPVLTTSAHDDYFLERPIYLILCDCFAGRIQSAREDAGCDGQPSCGWVLVDY